MADEYPEALFEEIGKMIAILDYDMGNVGSIKNMFRHIGANDVYITRDVNEIRSADKLILPGVGSFDAGMENIRQYRLIDEIYRHIEQGKPLLGICLGMQLLGKESEEGRKRGLGLIDFSSVRFKPDKDYTIKIPHMGWDYVKIKKEGDPLVKNLEESARFYFIHSYYAVCEETQNILMQCDYSLLFSAAVCKDNIYGVQFHPEKSHKFGMQLLKNFLDL